MMKKKTDEQVTQSEKPVNNVFAVPDAIWGKIKTMKLDMFALPNQTVENHATPLQVEPTKLYLTVRSTAAFAELAKVLEQEYVVEQVGKWVTVAKK